jgi:23S rRNA (adenine2503-C2)-methyltransferase
LLTRVPAQGLSQTEVSAALSAVEPDLPAFRGKQLHAAMYGSARIKELEGVTTFSKALREQLGEAGLRVGRQPVHTSVEAKDGTQKYLLRLADSRLVETVAIPALKSERQRLTACVSSQVGCPLRCTFCATGKGGFARNLQTYEIVDQVLTVEERMGRRVSNVVFMGMGEPMLNLKNVLPAIRCLNEDVGIGARHITLSTVGVPNTLRRLAEANLQTTLAVSLHAPNQRLREQLVPSAKAYPIEALLQDCAQYYAVTRRRVTFEYAMLGGVNDQPDHADELVQLLRRTRHGGAHVNLIPWNTVEGAVFQRPAVGAVRTFQRRLERAGLGCTIRASRGMDAAAACGQLRNAHQKEPLAA